MNRLFILILFTAAVISAQSKELTGLKGDYLGQKTPGLAAEIFAPGIVSTGMYTRDIAMTPDGKEIYFSVAAGNYAFTTIMITKMVNGVWTKPEVVKNLDNPEYIYLEPFISPDGKKFYFLSNMPDPANNEKEGDQDIWVMDRTGDGWGKPYNLGMPVNSDGGEYFPSVTKDGTIYFTRQEKGTRTNFIFRSRFKDGKYLEPEKLPAEVNCGAAQYNAFIAPDESFIIVPAAGRKDTYGGTDYYIVFRTPDDKWSQPINMGEKINSAAGLEYSPYVSPDGKYFFFMSNRVIDKSKWPKKLTYEFFKKLNNQPENGNPSIYWISSEIFKNLKHATN